MNAQDFALPDQDGHVRQLTDYLGKWIVLYFYPKDDTPGCTVEACAFRDSFEKLQASGVVVLGVSKDSVASHKKFAQKHNLNFPLLSDEPTEMIKSYGAWSERQFLGRPGVLRKTFLINPKGEIVKEYPKVNPIGHASAILADLTLLQ